MSVSEMRSGMENAIKRAWWMTALQGGHGIDREELLALLGRKAESEPVIAEAIRLGHLTEMQAGQRLRAGKQPGTRS